MVMQAVPERNSEVPSAHITAASCCQRCVLSVLPLLPVIVSRVPCGWRSGSGGLHQVEMLETIYARYAQ